MFPQLLRLMMKRIACIFLHLEGGRDRFSTICNCVLGSGHGAPCSTNRNSSVGRLSGAVRNAFVTGDWRDALEIALNGSCSFNSATQTDPLSLDQLIIVTSW